MAGKRILVTGGAGFIGSHVAERYVALGHTVLIVDNLSSGRRENLPAGAEFVEADILGESMGGIFDRFRPDVVSHHAAQIDVRRSVSDPRFDIQVNVLGTLNLLEHARRTGTGRFVFASSGGAAYGEQVRFPADETHPTDPCSPYGINKLTAEKYIQYMEQLGGPRGVLLRYSNVYGPRQDPHGEAGVVAIFGNRLLAGQACTIFGDGNQTRDYVYVGDVVEANVLALRDEARGAYNVGTGIETSVNALYEAMTRVLGVDLPAAHAEARAGEQQRSCIGPVRLEAECGWRPATSLADGLAVTLDSFRAISSR